MENNIDLEKLDDNELLALYDKVIEHIEYLNSNIISLEEEKIWLV